MTFLELYGEELNIELGSDDTTDLFTTARRKAAINAAQREFARRTEAFLKEENEPLVDAQQEYDLQTVIASNAFLKFSERQPYIKIDNGSTITYLEAAQFPRRDITDLDRSEPGWRTASAGVPVSWYLRRVDDSVYLGLYPAPSIPAGETWTLVIPYVAYPVDLSADADIPFEGSYSLQGYHRALVHYAASRLERLRRNYAGSRDQEQEFDLWVSKFEEDQEPTDGSQVTFTHDYFGAASGADNRPRDPRRWP